VFSSSSLLRCAGYVPFTIPISCDWYGSYENADIWDRLLAIVVRVMTACHSRESMGGCVFRGLFTESFDLNEQSEELSVHLLN
jgi:hypothetical protein